MLLVGSDDVGYVRHCGFYIPGHDVYRPQMVYFRQFKQLRLLLIAVFLHQIDLSTGLPLIFFLLRGLNEPQLRGHREMRHRAVNNQLVQPILKQVFFHGYCVLKVAEGHL